MLEAICMLLRGLSRVDDGAESLITQEALDGLTTLIRDVYGEHVATTVREFFYQTASNDALYHAFDDVEDAFRICLQGRG
jgi:hypothetical protein